VHSPMLSEGAQQLHLGQNIRLETRYTELHEVEKKIFRECIKRRVESSYDCTANEKPNFKTINYTTYAGVVIMHPLQPELTSYQLHDALVDNAPVQDWSGYFLNKYWSMDINKYTFAEREEFDGPCDVLVVLPGSNKIKSQICLDKVRWITDNYENVVFKPHPLTHHHILEEFVSLVPKAVLAPRHSNIYELMDQADTVFTTHISESALYARLLGKNVEPIDLYNARQQGAFSHINYHIFMGQGADWINRTFSSPYSGIVHPEMDSDWEAKIEAYFDYIMALRSRVATHFIL